MIEGDHDDIILGLIHHATIIVWEVKARAAKLERDRCRHHKFDDDENEDDDDESRKVKSGGSCSNSHISDNDFVHWR
jgi:hypothetical protein